jgi:hypothetical protein
MRKILEFNTILNAPLDNRHTYVLSFNRQFFLSCATILNLALPFWQRQELWS